MLVEKSCMSQGFKMEIIKQSAQVMSSMHYHDYFEIYIQDQGIQDYTTDNAFYKLNPRDIVFIKPNVLHQFLNSDIHSQTVICFTAAFLQKYFADETIQRFMSVFEYKHISLSVENYYRISAIVRDMKKVSALKADDFIFAKLAEFFALLLKNVSEQTTASMLCGSAAAQNTGGQVFPPLVAYVRENYLSLTSIDEIAATFYMTPSHLCRTFKKLTNHTIIQYINILKIQKSCELLHDTEKSITDIALDCGFNSSMYFCKTFKSLLNLSPTKYRRNIKEAV